MKLTNTIADSKRKNILLIENQIHKKISKKIKCFMPIGKLKKNLNKIINIIHPESFLRTIQQQIQKDKD